MKALTVQQPWAWAIVKGGKNVENRTQLWRYRGPLAIHAGARWSERGCVDERVLRAYTAELGFERWEGPYGGHTHGPIEPDYDTHCELIELSAIVGVVDLVDCHPDAGCCTPWGESVYVEHGGRERRRITHLVLENPRELAEPIPCKGAQGLWTPLADVLDRLRVGWPMPKQIALDGGSVMTRIGRGDGKPSGLPVPTR